MDLENLKGTQGIYSWRDIYYRGTNHMKYYNKIKLELKKWCGGYFKLSSKDRDETLIILIKQQQDFISIFEQS